MQLGILNDQVNHRLNVDWHADADGRYAIRRLPFYDYENSFYYENENGMLLIQGQACLLMEEYPVPDVVSQPEVLRILTKQMRNVVIVGYERIPYVY